MRRSRICQRRDRRGRRCRPSFVLMIISLGREWMMEEEDSPRGMREHTSRRAPSPEGRCVRREAPETGSADLLYIVEGTLPTLDTCRRPWGCPRPRPPRPTSGGYLGDTWKPAAHHACATTGISYDPPPELPSFHSPVVYPKERHLALPIHQGRILPHKPLERLW